MSEFDIIDHQDARAVDLAVARLEDGRLVGLPTETVYGLAGDATNDDAIAKIYHAKGRPAGNPLIVHVAGADDAQKFGVVCNEASVLMAKLWPGPLTLLLPKRDGCTLGTNVCARQDYVALRCPDVEVTRAIIAKLGRPLAMPSANISGTISPTTAWHVRKNFPLDVCPVIDAGACRIGLESTIVAVQDGQFTILRSGQLGRDDILDACPSLTPMPDKETTLVAPGQMLRHYAPRANVRINVSDPRADESYVGFGDMGGARLAVNLSVDGDMAQAAKSLFPCLFSLDAKGVEKIAFAPIPDHGIGVAINDRLRRAAGVYEPLEENIDG